MKRKSSTLSLSRPNGNRVAIYVRVSTALQAEEGFSLDAQEKVCRQFAENRAWQVVEVFREPGVSAKDDNRPAFQRMISAAKARQFDVILTHKLDRFSRSILDVLTYLRDLHEWDVAYASATENFDFSTPMGKMQLHMMAAMAQWYLDNLSQETQKGKRARAEAGLWNGDLPYGYRSTDARSLAVDEQEAEGIRLAFRLCAAGGSSDAEIAEVLNQQGHRTRGKRGRRLFSKDTVRALLRNPFYLGSVKYRTQAGSKKYDLHPGRQAAIIDQSLWDRAQQARSRRYTRPLSAKRTDRVYPLSSLIRCGSCQTPMRGQGIRQQRYYRDPAKDMGKACDQPTTVAAPPLEAELVQFFSHVQLTDEIKQRVLSNLDRSGDAGREARERGRLASQLERAKKLFVLNEMTEAEYWKEKARIDAALAQLQPAEAVDLEQAAQLLGSLGQALAVANDAERQQLLQTVLDDVYVKQKKVVAIRPKPNYYHLLLMSPADPTRFELAISALTGPHVWPLHHGSE